MESIIVGIILAPIFVIALSEDAKRKKIEKCRKAGIEITKRKRGRFFYEETCVFEGKTIRGNLRMGRI
jgi:biotin operon repressor